MLVHNRVKGDSRVQKVARSAAEAGWDVVLLGRSPDRQEHSWLEGKANVRLVPVPSPLNRRRHDFRRPWLRGPLAYPPTGIAAHRMQWVKAWRADLRVRGALLAGATRSGRSGIGMLLRKRALRAEAAAARALGRWVCFRSRQLTRAQEARRKLDGPWDRAQAHIWQRLMGDRAWRRLDPRLWDFELAYGKRIDRLKPDLIHAHDFRMIGVGARAAIRGRAAGRPVKLVWDAHEYLPGVSPGGNTARWLPAHCASEREYAPHADAVVTVSESLAQLLQEDHRLAELPTVVLNAPEDDRVAKDGDAPMPALRGLCGIGNGVPLLVYSGGAVAHRGLDIMVDALPRLADAHVAFIVPQPEDPYVASLRDRAAQLGAGDRVHVLDYVPYWQVVPFLSAADVGVIPIHHWPNHEIALITKFFEYSHARLPIVVSDVRTMAETTRSTGQGEVFRAEDLDDFVRAVSAVLADPQRYRSAYDRPGLLQNWTWRSQAKILDDVYGRLVPTAGQRAAGRLLPVAGVVSTGSA
jgi:glycosyltransferase involved in cell wall biosynthesis